MTPPRIVSDYETHKNEIEAPKTQIKKIKKKIRGGQTSYIVKGL